MKKSFIAALLFGSLLSAKGWGVEGDLSTVLGARRVSNLPATQATLARYGVEGLDPSEAVQSWCDLVQVMIDPSQLPVLLSELRAIGTEGVGAGAPVSAAASAAPFIPAPATAATAPELLGDDARAPDPARTETLLPALDLRGFLERIAAYDEDARTKAIAAWFRKTWDQPGGTELLLDNLQSVPELDISELMSKGRISYQAALNAYQFYFSMALSSVGERHMKEGEAAVAVSAPPSLDSATLRDAITRAWSTTQGMQRVLQEVKKLPEIDESCLAPIAIGVSDVLAIIGQQTLDVQQLFLQKIMAHTPMPAVSTEESVGHGAGRGVVASKMTMTGEDLKSLDEGVRIHRETPQDTDVHVFNAHFSGPVVQGINGLATRVIGGQSLVLPSLGELVGLTDNSEARAILTSANINGHDSESGGVSLHAATEVQEAYALAEFVDRWEHAGIHRFEDSSGVQVAGNLVGLLFHKLGENVATGGGCTAGIRGRATEVKLICLNILRDKGFFNIG